MPLADNAWDRLKAAFRATSTTELDGKPAMQVLSVDGSGNPIGVGGQATVNINGIPTVWRDWY